MLKLAICLGDAGRLVEARGGTINFHLIGQYDCYLDRKRGIKGQRLRSRSGWETRWGECVCGWAFKRGWCHTMTRSP